VYSCPNFAAQKSRRGIGTRIDSRIESHEFHAVSMRTESRYSLLAPIECANSGNRNANDRSSQAKPHYGSRSLAVLGTCVSLLITPSSLSNESPDIPDKMDSRLACQISKRDSVLLLARDTIESATITGEIIAKPCNATRAMSSR